MTPPDSGLRGRTARGGVITLAGQAAKFTVGLAATMVLARQLTPADFGLIAMVLAGTDWLIVLQSLGFDHATVQTERLHNDEVSGLFWLHVLTGALLMAVMMGLGPILARVNHEPQLTAIAMAMAPAMLLGALAVQPQALLNRALRFRALATIDVASLTLASLCGIVLAFYGFGHWALAAIPVALAATRLVMLWLASGFLPTPPRGVPGLGRLVGFGVDLTVFQLVNYLARNADNALIGWRWGAESLGLYSRAYRLLLMPLAQIAGPLATVAIPTLSRLQRAPDDFRRYYCESLRVIAWLTLPLVAALFALAPSVVLLVLGPNWQGAVPLFRILAVAGFLQPLMTTSSWLLISLGQTRRMRAWGFISVPPTVLAFVVGLPWGPSGVATAYAVVFNLLVVPGFLFALQDGPVSFRDVVDTVFRPVAFSLAAGGVMLSSSLLVPMAPPALVIAVAAVAMTLFSCVALAVFPRLRADVRDAAGLVRLLT